MLQTPESLYQRCSLHLSAAPTRWLVLAVRGVSLALVQGGVTFYSPPVSLAYCGCAPVVLQRALNIHLLSGSLTRNGYGPLESNILMIIH